MTGSELRLTVAIDEAEQVNAMSRRNFLRRFKREMGVMPSGYLFHVQIGLCCRLRLASGPPVDKIVRCCELGSGGWLANLLRSHLSTTPTGYRANGRRVSNWMRARERHDVLLGWQLRSGCLVSARDLQALE